MKTSSSTRRQFLTTVGTASAALFSAPYIKTARSAGTLKLAVWDHWIPGANETFRTLCEEWAATNGVEIHIDFIADEQMIPLAQSESRAQAGHDIIELPRWGGWMFRNSLEPVDEVISAITSTFGELTSGAQYTGQVDGVWRAVPIVRGGINYAIVSRLDLVRQYAGIDLQALFPAHSDHDPILAAQWNSETFLDAAKALQQAGYPFGSAISPTVDAQRWLEPLYNAFGAVLIDASGAITVDSDATRQFLEYIRELTQYMPPDIYAWDNASNNRWLISGKGAMICNPPSAWVIALREQAAIGAQLYHHPMPAGPAGRFRAFSPQIQGIWRFSEQKSAAKDLLIHLNAVTDSVDRIIIASQGYDLPQFKQFHHPIWETAGPPAGTLYHYPIRGDEIALVPSWPAPPAVAARLEAEKFLVILTAKVTQGGESVNEAINWASRELEYLLSA